MTLFDHGTAVLVHFTIQSTCKTRLSPSVINSPTFKFLVALGSKKCNHKKGYNSNDMLPLVTTVTGKDASPEPTQLIALMLTVSSMV